MHNLPTKDKSDNKKYGDIKVSKNNKINSVNRNNIYSNDISDHFDNYHFEKIKNKIILKNKKITKFYDFFIQSPKVQKCYFSHTLFKKIKYPKPEYCYFSKVNSVIYILYKNKSLCYITKERSKKITQPPISSVCQYSKNIILNLAKIQTKEKNEIKNDNQEKKEENNTQLISNTKKNKKRKRRKKSKKLNKEENVEKNNNLTEAKKENTDITSKDLSKEENEKEIKDKNLEEKIENINIDSKSNNENENKINNINISFKTPEENNIISIPKNLMLNYKSSPDDRSAFSDKEIDKNTNSIKKKIKSYNLQ